MRKFLALAVVLGSVGSASARERQHPIRDKVQAVVAAVSDKLHGRTACQQPQSSPGPVQHAVQWTGQRVEQTGRTIQSFQLPRLGTCTSGACGR